MSKPFKQLYFWNPFDYLRLLWWIFVMPQRFKNYQEAFAEKEKEQMITWLINTLIWLPLLLPSLILGFKQAFIINAWQLESYLILSVLIGLWLITGWLANIYKDWIVIVALTMLVAMVIGFATILGIALDHRSIKILMLFSGIEGLVFGLVFAITILPIKRWKNSVIASIATSFYGGMVAVIVTGVIASIVITTHNPVATFSVNLVAIIAISTENSRKI